MMSFFVNVGTISGEDKSTNVDTSTMISFFSVNVDTMIVDKFTLTKTTHVQIQIPTRSALRQQSGGVANGALNLPARALDQSMMSITLSSSADELAPGALVDTTLIQNRKNPQVSPASAPSPTPEATGGVAGPSELYRLKAHAPHHEERPDYWRTVLERARSHSHEACFYDPDVGGHVYALHRLLRRTASLSSLMSSQ